MAEKSVFPQEENRLKNFYLLASPESYLIEEQLSGLKENFSIRTGDFNWINLSDSSEDFWQELNRAVFAVSMMTGHKFVLVDCDRLFQQKTRYDDRLAELLEKEPREVTVIFLVEGSVDGRFKLVRKVKNRGEYFKLKPPQYQQLDSWIEEKFRTQGKKVEPKLVQYLEYLFDNKLQALNQEIEKLITLNIEEEYIDFNSSRYILSRGGFLTDQMIFELLDHWTGSKTTRAVRLYRRLVQSGEEPLMILAMIHRQLRLLLVVKELREEENLNPGEIASRIEEHPYPVKKCYRQVPHFSFSQLESALENLLGVNRKIVTGMVDSPEQALEDYLLRNLGG